MPTDKETSEGFENYLLYSELSAVWSRMPEDSVLVVYQHLQKDARKRSGDVVRRMHELGGQLGATTRAVQWNDLAFLVSVRQPEVSERIRKALHEHARRNGIVLHDAAASHLTTACSRRHAGGYWAACRG